MAKKKKEVDAIAESTAIVSNPSNALSYKVVLKCMNKKQKDLVKAIEDNKITFVQGVFGVGKTFVINSVALQMLKNPENNIKKIILILPTNQCSSMDIGLLPGTQDDKTSAFSINEYDAFRKILQKSGNCCPEMQLNCLIENGFIETRPLSFLRGASFEDAFICVSEAEEFTREELFLILSRYESGKIVISGDPLQAYRSQVKNGNSGLLHGIERLEGLDGVGVVRFEDEDIVRNDILLDIYRKWKD